MAARHLPMDILVIEDEMQLARHLCSALKRAGHEVRCEHDGAAGLASLLDRVPDLVVLDLNLPTLNGMEVLHALRSKQLKSRVIILTARGDVGDRIRGLNAGADDYVPKPFSVEELMARVEALGRRSSSPVAGDLLVVGDLKMDVRQRRVTRAGEVIALSPRELELLWVLMEEPGRVFTRTELTERVWQREHGYDTRTVEIFIARLRKKIDATFEQPLIHTLRAVGYTIKAPS